MFMPLLRAIFDLLIQQTRQFLPEIVVIGNEKHYLDLKEALSDIPVKVFAGLDAIVQVAEMEPIDILLTAMVGYADSSRPYRRLKREAHCFGQ